MQRVLHQDGDRAADAQVIEGDGVATDVRSDHDPSAAGPEVAERRGVVVPVGERQNRHQLGSHRDVVTGLAGPAVDTTAQAQHHVTKCPIVDVDHAAPLGPEHVDIEPLQPDRLELGVAHASLVVPARVHGSGRQVVGHADGMHITGQVQVELVHGDDLAVATPRCTALDPESRSHRGLADGRYGLLPEETQSLNQTDRGGGLALPERGGRDRGDVDVLAGRAGADPLQYVEVDLRLG